MDLPTWKILSSVKFRKTFIIYSNNHKFELNQIEQYENYILINKSFLLSRLQYVGNLDLDLLFSLQKIEIKTTNEINGGTIIKEYYLRYKNKKLYLTNKKYENVIEIRTLRNKWVCHIGGSIYIKCLYNNERKNNDGEWIYQNSESYLSSISFDFVDAMDNETLKILDLLLNNKLELDEKCELEYEMIKNTDKIKLF